MPQTADFRRQVTPSGQTRFDGADAEELLLRGCDINQLCFSLTPAIERQNLICLQQDKPPLATQLPVSGMDRVLTWWLEEPYLHLPIRPLLLARCERMDEISRVHQEMDIYEAKGLVPVLRVMTMLVDHWRANDVVWGVGRGSSTASYVLFLLGLHKIDSLKYDLQFQDFLKV